MCCCNYECPVVVFVFAAFVLISVVCGLPQLGGDSAFLPAALAALRTVFLLTSLFVRFNQRLENNR